MATKAKTATTARKTSVNDSIMREPVRFRLIGMHPATFTLNVGRNKSLLVFDEKSGHQRAIRHCPNERSIFVDEQSDDAVVEPIVIEKGSILVGPEQVSTIKFLRAHPKNGGVFEEVNESKEAEESLEAEDMVLEVKNAIRTKAKEKGGILEMQAVVAVMTGSVETARRMDVSQLKMFLYQKAESHPRRFFDDHGNLNIFESDYVARKYFVLNAIKDGILIVNHADRTVKWAKGGQEILSASVGVDPIDKLTEFLATKEGLALSEDIKAA